jgi:Lanthionine synthetase C-like protein
VLYGAGAHEPLEDGEWSETRVRNRVHALAAATAAACAGEDLWPAHPADLDTGGMEPPLASLYFGAAGVVAALDILHRRGYWEASADLGRAAASAFELSQQRLDIPPDETLPQNARASLWLGETGTALVAWRIAPTPALADAVYARVSSNVANETNEIMWGAPGTMLAARAMHAWTRETRWLDIWHESAETLWARWRKDDRGAWLWEQRLYTMQERFLGPAHGFAGNVLALAQGDLGTARDAELRERARITLERTAVREDGLANWPPLAHTSLAGPDGQIRLQWCHGAPGIVASLAGVLDGDLLRAGAELTWRAGGLRKGPGLCHGTAGSGYALLKMFATTGDELWLVRARRFALHALAQAEAEARHSLWTGGIGAALFAAACIDGRDAFPTLDGWD